MSFKKSKQLRVLYVNKLWKKKLGFHSSIRIWYYCMQISLLYRIYGVHLCKLIFKNTISNRLTTSPSFSTMFISALQWLVSKERILFSSLTWASGTRKMMFKWPQKIHQAPTKNQNVKCCHICEKSFSIFSIVLSFCFTAFTL